jgi:multiple sugar transport system permease protein
MSETSVARRGTSASNRPITTTSYRVRRVLIEWGLVLFSVIGIILVIAPLVWMALSGFKSREDLITIPIRLLPRVWYPSNYVQIFEVTPLGRGMLNSAFTGAVICATTVFLSTMGGYAFAKIEFPGREVLFLIILSTMMVPFFLRAIPLFVMMAGAKPLWPFWFLRVRWVNTYQAQVVPHLVSAFGIFMLRQFMLDIPDDLVDAARIDGSSEFGILWRIMLPMVKPAAAALTIFTFVWNWNQLFWPMLVAKTESMYSLSVAVYYMQDFYSRNENLIMAAGTLTIIPPIIVFLFLQERIVEGVTLTGLKGV